jgi:hypothetical protein
MGGFSISSAAVFCSEMLSRLLAKPIAHPFRPYLAAFLFKPTLYPCQCNVVDLASFAFAS